MSKRIYPTDPYKFSCVIEGAQAKCTYDAYKTVYFSNNGRSYKNQLKIEVPWYARMCPSLYIMFKTRTFGVIWRDGAPPSCDQNETWQTLIDSGDCYIG